MGVISDTLSILYNRPLNNLYGCVTGKPHSMGGIKGR